ncbi:alpha/beta hydrolase [Flavobacterium sp. CYK-4]|uniref:alpha/beta hydrolase n=1 Tax=Flavobacterium lotistagni TaxID=2709660 RepID=UPI00140AA808|nr:alpha/beta hydrolase-fold protein [Flavobacterium lotistagni]NHM06191.1 alpha/beta hydrolase [Flavobacterium lotistagni]
MKHLLIFAVALITGWAFCQQKNTIGKSKPFIIGATEELQSKILGETRLLNIYLPEGYLADETTKYPVIYLLDGSADEDFIHVVGLVQFDSFEWVDIIPKSIVVGIATVDRRRDFTFPTTVEADKKNFPTSGHSNQFIEFIEKELQPFIQNRYRAHSSKTIIGQSLGGLLATEILFKKPSLFNKYVIVSPSLWWDNGSLLNVKPVLVNKPTDVYIGVGKEGLAPTALPRVMEVDANLLVEKINKMENKKINIHFDYLPQEDHATIMHQAISNAFRVIYHKE